VRHLHPSSTEVWSRPNFTNIRADLIWKVATPFLRNPPNAVESKSLGPSSATQWAELEPAELRRDVLHLPGLIST
jgi:hypothetical protein